MSDIKILLQPSAESKPKLTMIYKSVSTADSSETVRSMLAQHENGLKIVLGSEDVSIAEDIGENGGIEPGRIKASGTYSVEIRVKGCDAIRRTVCEPAVIVFGDRSALPLISVQYT